MQESDTYLAILDEGAAKALRKLLLLLGQTKFGPPSEDVVTAVQGIEDPERLERLIVAYTKLSSWRELLQVP